jgi:hypothetical protein
MACTPRPGEAASATGNVVGVRAVRSTQSRTNAASRPDLGSDVRLLPADESGGADGVHQARAELPAGGSVMGRAGRSAPVTLAPPLLGVRAADLFNPHAAVNIPLDLLERNRGSPRRSRRFTGRWSSTRGRRGQAGLEEVRAGGPPVRPVVRRGPWPGWPRAGRQPVTN